MVDLDEIATTLAGCDGLLTAMSEIIEQPVKKAICRQMAAKCAELCHKIIEEIENGEYGRSESR